jgi:hypothetical protein
LADQVNAEKPILSPSLILKPPLVKILSITDYQLISKQIFLKLLILLINRTSDSIISRKILVLKFD